MEVWGTVKGPSEEAGSLWAVRRGVPGGDSSSAVP